MTSNSAGVATAKRTCQTSSPQSISKQIVNPGESNMPVYANVITTRSWNATCHESSCERMSNLQHQLPSSPDWFSHGPAVENGLAFISRSYQISSSTRRWSRTMMNDQWFPLQGHPDASKHPPTHTHVWCVPVCVCACARLVCVCVFPVTWRWHLFAGQMKHHHYDR